MRSKWFASLVGIGLLLAGGAFFLFRGPEVAPLGTALSPDANVRSTAVKEDVASFQEAKAGARVQEFYKKESARVGAVDPDPKLTEQRLRAVAGELKPEELDWLRAQALNKSEEGDARFFAVYLLALAPASEASLSQLRAVALSPLPESKNQGLVELERQIRAQAVEGISRAKGKPAARDALLDVIQQQQDEFLQDRAHRGIYSWETGKPIEDQDQKGLEKVLYGK